MLILVFLSHPFCRIAVAELTDSFALLKKTLDTCDETDSKLEPQQSSDNNKETSVNPEDKNIQNGASNLTENIYATSMVQCRSIHELETILIFDLCALSEIATSKSAILRVRL